MMSFALILAAGLALLASSCSPAQLTQALREGVEPSGEPPPRPAPDRKGLDTASDLDPLPFWGAVDCESPRRAEWIEADGDPEPTAAGAPQGNAAFRRLTVFDGDDFFGERCELGLNNIEGPVTFYDEGERWRTFASFRLPPNFPLEAERWQGGLQMKQTQPAGNGGGTPVISLSAFDGRWQLWHSDPGYTEVDHELWSAPAEKGAWTRVRFDVLYSDDPERGSIEVGVDLNSDGDFDDAAELSPRFETNTLKGEVGADETDGIAAGEPIPSHLRIGLYHDSAIKCPPPEGCSLDIDNVQVVRG